MTRFKVQKIRLVRKFHQLISEEYKKMVCSLRILIGRYRDKFFNVGMSWFLLRFTARKLIIKLSTGGAQSPVGGHLARAELRQPRNLFRGSGTVWPHPQVRREAHPHRRQEGQSHISGRRISFQTESGD